MQQQRAVVEGLIADRENARYTDLAVRYRSGLSNQPPPPARPDVSAPAAAAAKALVPAPPRPEPTPVNATEANPAIGNRNNGSFSDFLRGMVHDTTPEPATTEDTPEPQTHLTPDELLQNMAAEAKASSKRIAVPAAAPDDFKRAELLAMGRMIRLARATDAMAATAPVAAATSVSVPEL